MNTKRLSLLAAGGIGLSLTLLAIGAGVPVQAQNASLAMLDGLAKGEWTLRFRDGAAPRRICLKSGQELIQLRHRDPGCSRFVVDDATQQVTVHYTCPGNGYGRTSIRRETGGLVQIESQGIADGLPFQFTAEARRTGSCG